ncbi:hypothetical protein CHS0354_012014 [Potamilus streckersoni]|uniref:Uncharacterized protein n=1 Tax=Potamilus streckersoni TaxID=2493646 RepID=A0AAE0SBE9_9BIVA|nr:hypothetical protein CHS0354_012014 [Potamilus streckersoni]
MDEKAAACVSYAKERCPKITKTPREIYSDGMRKVVTTMINATEAFAKSKPGQAVIRGLDWSIVKGENLIEYLEDHGPHKGQKRRRTRTKADLEKHPDKPHASSDSGVKSEMKESSSDLVRQVSSETSNSEKKRRLQFLLSSAPISYRIYHVAVILPLELLVVIMIRIHRFLYKHGGKKALRGKDTVEDKPLTPEKVAEIESRRKAIVLGVTRFGLSPVMLGVTRFGLSPVMLGVTRFGLSPVMLGVTRFGLSPVMLGVTRFGLSPVVLGVTRFGLSPVVLGETRFGLRPVMMGVTRIL